MNTYIIYNATVLSTDAAQCFVSCILLYFT